MNISVGLLRAGHDRTEPAASAAVPAGAVQAGVVTLGSGLSVLIFDQSGANRARLVARRDGVALPGPVVSTALPLAAGGLRHAVFLDADAATVAAWRLTLTLGDRTAAFLDPSWLQSPRRDLAALTDGLSPQGGQRLARALLTTAASLFAKSTGAEFAAMAKTVLRLIKVPVADAVSACPVGAAGIILTFRLDAATCVPNTFVALTPVARLAGLRACLEPQAGGALLHVFRPGPPDRLAEVAVFCPEPVILRDVGCRARPLGPWLARRPAATLAWCRDLLTCAADPQARASLRELDHAHAPHPTLAIRHLSATRDGILVLVAADDPHRLVSAVRIERGAQVAHLPLPQSGVLAALVALPCDIPGTPCRVRLVMGSGQVRTVHHSVPEPFCGALPVEFRGTVPGAAETLAAARLVRVRPSFTPEVHIFGPAPAPVRLRIIAPVGSNPDILRARAAMVLGDPAATACEVICTVAAARAPAAARLLAEIEAVYGVPHRLVILPDSADATERLRAALQTVTGGPVLLLGADVLPERPDWCTVWAGMLSRTRRPVIIGGTLLNPDRSVRDAGGDLARPGAASTVQRFRGLPAGDLPATQTAPTDRVTAACVGLSAAAVADLSRLTTSYPNPDILLGELVARQRHLRGRAETALRQTFVSYGGAIAADDLDTACDAAARGLVARAADMSKGVVRVQR